MDIAVEGRDAVDNFSRLNRVVLTAVRSTPLLGSRWTDRLRVAQFGKGRALQPVVYHVNPVGLIIELPTVITPHDVLAFGLPTLTIAHRGSSVGAQWLLVAQCPHVKVLLLRGDPTDLTTLSDWIEVQIFGLSGVVDRLISHAPKLAEARELIEIVLGSPKTVRRPADIAFRMGIPKSAVSMVARQVGFKRVEHFTTFVREGARRTILCSGGISQSVARHALGIEDTSNFRRQLRRMMASPNVPQLPPDPIPHRRSERVT